MKTGNGNGGSDRGSLWWVLLAPLLLGSGGASATQDLSAFEDPATGFWGYRDARGAVVIAPRFIVAQDFSAHGIAAVADAAGWKFIGQRGEVLVPQPYLVDNGPDPFQEGLARFVEAGRIGFFDARGRVVIPARFVYVAPFAEGRAAFCEGCREQVEGEHRTVLGGRWGFIDRRGKTVIHPRYAAAEPFAQGRAQVLQEGRWVVVDRQGRLLAQ